MGYDWFFRVALDVEDEEILEKIGEKFRKKFGQDDIECIGTTQHGGAGGFYSGGEELVEFCKKITKLYPNGTFTFYNFHYDYEGLEIIKIKGKEVLLQEQANPPTYNKHGVVLPTVFSRFCVIDNDITNYLNPDSEIG